MNILNQWQNPTCGNFAVMAILSNKWIGFDLERLSTIRVPYINQLEKLFIEEGLIKKFIKIPTPKLVDLWLRRWEYILAQTLRWDFSLEDNVWKMLEFDENYQHYFVIIQDCWDKWKCQNSWGKDWNWDWCFYMKKSDFWYLMTPRRVITK